MQISLPTLSPAAKALWILLVLLLGGFLLGRWLNRTRSKAIGKWLQSGAQVLGTQLTWRFPGGVSAGAEVTISKANAPFQRVAIRYHLLTRELPLLWGIEWIRGKRDMLVIRADLQSRPLSELEVVPLRGELRRTLDQHAGEHPWRWTEMAHGLGMATHDPAGQSAERRVRAFLELYGHAVQRLSLRERNPNLILFVHASGIGGETAKEFMRALRRLFDPLEGRKG